MTYLSESECRKMSEQSEYSTTLRRGYLCTLKFTFVLLNCLELGIRGLRWYPYFWDAFFKEEFFTVCKIEIEVPDTCNWWLIPEVVVIIVTAIAGFSGIICNTPCFLYFYSLLRIAWLIINWTKVLIAIAPVEDVSFSYLALTADALGVMLIGFARCVAAEIEKVYGLNQPPKPLDDQDLMMATMMMRSNFGPPPRMGGGGSMGASGGGGGYGGGGRYYPPPPFMHQTMPPPHTQPFHDPSLGGLGFQNSGGPPNAHPFYMGPTSGSRSRMDQQQQFPMQMMPMINPSASQHNLAQQQQAQDTGQGFGIGPYQRRDLMHYNKMVGMGPGGGSGNSPIPPNLGAGPLDLGLGQMGPPVGQDSGQDDCSPSLGPDILHEHKQQFRDD